jgi:integrase
MAELAYGSGLRLMELLRLRVQHLDLERRQLHVKGGKGDKDRVTVIPESLVPALQRQLERLRPLYEADRKADMPGVWLSDGLEKKFKGAGERWEWQWLFPSREACRDPVSGLVRRHHTLDGAFQSAVRKAGAAAGINMRTTPHVFRHRAQRAPLRCAAGPALDANRGLTIYALSRSVLRDPSAGRRHRLADRAGIAGTCGHPDRANLPALHEKARGVRSPLDQA